MAHGAPRASAQASTTAAASLTATAHPPVPSDSGDVWFAPAEAPRGSTTSAFSRGVAELIANRPEAALPLLSQPPADPQLSGYQQYYRALALTRLGRQQEAASVLETLVQSAPQGYLSEAVLLRAGELAESTGDAANAAAHYATLSRAKTLTPDDVLLRLGRTRLAAGQRDAAAEAFARLYFEFPLSGLAATASSQLDTMSAWDDIQPGSQRYKLELGRAERLFASRRYPEAREAFQLLQPHAHGDDRELVALRLAESDHYLKRYGAAREALEPWTREARRQAEAKFFYLTATRELDEHADYVRLAEELISTFPDDLWTEETLNNLATHYILVDEDDKADETFLLLSKMFPDGRHAPRAAWKTGWNAYRQGRHADCAAIFEQAAAQFPRSDYRPSWIYWAARSRDQLGDSRVANRWYSILIADYQNSYYGRIASRTLTSRQVEPMTMAVAVASGTDGQLPSNRGAVAVPTARVIRALIAEALYDDALMEVQWAQKAWGDSPQLQATAGLIYSRKGDLRRGINAVKRAYPQYMAAGGEELPSEVLEVLFPVAYWSLIQKYAPPRGLDPYMIAALMAQESTFDAQIRSSANAIGLMQIVPATGRRYARQLRIRHFSASKLEDPETNVRIGTAYFADLVERFGGPHLALASYNAGPSPVSRWIAERPGIARDEFIDDIPYPETQNYVKKILGTADDYRRLYGAGGTARPTLRAPGSRAVATVTPASRATPTKASPAKKSPAKKKVIKKRRRR